MQKTLKSIRSFATIISITAAAITAMYATLQKAKGIEPNPKLMTATEILFIIFGLLVFSYILEIIIYAWPKKK